ncbi:MAG TPA: HAD hydrolase-like protein [bacterium]|nr:HAD hydrolase-like protein [bacterium]
MKMLLFDIDGTLLLTGGAGAIAFNKAFLKLFGIPDAWGDTKPHGKTDPVIIEEIALRVLRRNLTPKEYRTLCVHYLAYFEKELHRARQFRLMPGIPELLLSLSKRKDILMGLATGNFEKVSWLKLRRGMIDHFFRFGGFGSDSSDRVEFTATAVKRGRKLVQKRVKQSDIFVIGDTPKDILTGKDLRVKTVAVSTGSSSESELAKHNPDHLFPDFKNAELFLKRILS